MKYSINEIQKHFPEFKIKSVMPMDSDQFCIIQGDNFIGWFEMIGDKPYGNVADTTDSTNNDYLGAYFTMRVNALESINHIKNGK